MVQMESTLLIIGFIMFVIGLPAELIMANRKILGDMQHYVWKLEYNRNNE